MLTRGRASLSLAIFSLVCLAIPVSGLVWPKPPEKPRLEYLYSFSKPSDLKIEKKNSEKVMEFIFGKGKGEVDALARPQGIAGRDGKILVTDTLQACVHVFDERRQEYFKIKKAGADALLFPVGVATDGRGQIYVTDSKLNKVLIFSPKGEFVAELGKGKFYRPTGIAVDDIYDRIYVTDTLAGKIEVFNVAGLPLMTFGTLGAGRGNFNHPVYLAVGQYGDLYVVDSLNFRVEIFAKDGKLKNVFGKMGRAPGAFSQPKGIALDSDQNIYVTDSSFDNVQIFNPAGKLLLFFGEPGDQAGQLWLPAGIAIDGDKIYVADSYNSRVQVFRILK